MQFPDFADCKGSGDFFAALRNDGLDGAGMRNVEKQKTLKGEPINVLHLKNSPFAPSLKKLRCMP